MSFEAMKWASAQEAGTSTNKLLLLLLANYADQDFTCFPSIKKLAVMAECGESTVRRSLKDLAKRDLIEIRTRFEPYGERCRQTSNIYTLRGFQNETHPPVKLTPAPLSKSTGDITNHINQSIYTIGTSTIPRDEGAILRIKNSYQYSKAFEEFWNAYPRRPNSSKKDAFAKYKKAITKISEQDLLKLTKQFAKTMVNKDPQYIPHASTWLNQERFADLIDEPKVKTNKNRIAG